MAAGAASGMRQRHKQRTRRALENAALELFAERGYDQTSVEAIAERADVSPRTFFRYFTAKEDVVLDLSADEPQLFQEAVVARPAGEGLLVALREGYADLVTREGEEARRRMFLRNRVIQAMPLLRGHGAFRVEVEWLDAIAEAVARRLGEPEPAPEHRLMAAVVMTAIRSAVARWVEGEAREPLEDLARDSFACLSVAMAALLEQD